MKTFVKIIKTFFLIVFILIIGGVVGYTVHYMGYDKVILGKINPAWGETKTVENTIVDNTAPVANNTVIQNTVANEIADIKPNELKFPEASKDFCFYSTILHVSPSDNGNTNIIVKEMETNDLQHKNGNVTFTINNNLPVYYNGININSREGSEKIREEGLSITLSAGVDIAVYYDGNTSSIAEASPAILTGLTKIVILSEFPLQKEIPNLYNIMTVSLFNTSTSQMAYLEGTERSDLLLFINNNAFISNAYTIRYPQILDGGTVYTLSITDNNGITTRYDIVKYIDTFDPWYVIYKLDGEGRRMNWATEFVNTNQTEFITGILNRFGI